MAASCRDFEKNPLDSSLSYRSGRAACVCCVRPSRRATVSQRRQCWWTICQCDARIMSFVGRESDLAHTSHVATPQYADPGIPAVQRSSEASPCLTMVHVPRTQQPTSGINPACSVSSHILHDEVQSHHFTIHASTHTTSIIPCPFPYSQPCSLQYPRPRKSMLYGIYPKHAQSSDSTTVIRYI
jgi:hypothetical protein